MGPTALRPIRRTKQWLSVLLKDTSVTAGDSNPHSADQKHQSLNSVLLTARPRHFHFSHVMIDFEVQTDKQTNIPWEHIRGQLGLGLLQFSYPHLDGVYADKLMDGDIVLLANAVDTVAGLVL